MIHLRLKTGRSATYYNGINYFQVIHSKVCNRILHTTNIIPTVYVGKDMSTLTLRFILDYKILRLSKAHLTTKFITIKC